MEIALLFTVRLRTYLIDIGELRVVTEHAETYLTEIVFNL